MSHYCVEIVNSHFGILDGAMNNFVIMFILSHFAMYVLLLTHSTLCFSNWNVSI